MKLYLFILIFFINFFNIYSQNNQPSPEEKPPTKEETSKPMFDNYQLSLDGIFFPRYEMKDRTPIGRDDLAGSSEQTTGFTLARTYLNLRGKVKEGELKGYSFRLTSDITPFGTMGDGCINDTCTRSNPYTMYLKYAFVNIPVLKRKDTFIRLGLQHDPTVNAQSRISLQEDGWGHRYIARTTWEDIGLAPSVDRGISIIHNSTFYAGHILLGNGEGPFRNNAERISTPFVDPKNGVRRLSEGVNDSYGLSLSGIFSIIPTGENAKNILSINFPFRLENVVGVSNNEVQFLAIDICGNQTALPANAIVTTFNAPSTVCEFSQSGIPNFSYYRGTKRAKQDLSYGTEVDYTYNNKEFKFTIGAGTVLKIDRRGEAVRLSRGLLLGQNPSISASEFTSYYQTQTDTVGNANYILAHVKWKDYGAFARHTIGTAGNLLGQLGTRASKSWTQQVLEQDSANNIFGDLSYTDLNRLDMGKAVFKSSVLGVTYYFTPSFIISFGLSETRATDTVGRRARENVLERFPAIAGSSASGRNLSEQLESPQAFYSYTSFYNSLGYNLPGQFATNEWIGKEIIDRQVFLRAQFIFGEVERMSERN